MYAIILDEENYLKDYSDRFRKPESILVNSIPDEEDPEKLQCYKYINNKFVLDVDKWAAISEKRAEAVRIADTKQQIQELKEKLVSSDYQIIKCYEYALNDLELPYDVAKLHAERQAYRDQINELEISLSQ